MAMGYSFKVTICDLKREGKDVGKSALIPAIEQYVFEIRGHKVILDSNLALIYGVTTKALNQAVMRNKERFPHDFMLRLTEKKVTNLRSQIVTSSFMHGGRRYAPLAFTEQGVAMLSGVLHSPRAIQANIEIMRTFVRMRQIMMSRDDLAKKMETLERKHDKQFKIVFDALRKLMEPPKDSPKPRIGFHARTRNRSPMAMERTCNGQTRTTRR